MHKFPKQHFTHLFDFMTGGTESTLYIAEAVPEWRGSSHRLTADRSPRGRTDMVSKVDLHGLEPSGPGWEEAWAALTASMEAHGAVLVMHEALGPDLRQGLFGRAVPDGYIGPRPQAPTYGSACVRETTLDGCVVRDATAVVWPDGNPAFCDTIETFAENMLGLQKTLETMILEGLGVRKENVDAHLRSLTYRLRLSHYGSLAEMGNAMYMQAHKDCTVLSLLQVQGGSWLPVPAEPGTFAVVAGELLTIVTNGRVPANVHRVRTPSDRERFSAQVRIDGAPCGRSSSAKIYNPCNFDEYVNFRFMGDGRKLSDPLEGFCGAVKD
ncbi:hypothetical protein EJB05_49184, partial [Eragrostis curvula]